MNQARRLVYHAYRRTTAPRGDQTKRIRSPAGDSAAIRRRSCGRAARRPIGRRPG